jgi:hypothetical protein
MRNTAEKEIRNYPEQPPVMPHSIDGYQIDMNGNKCLSCHARARSGESQAPMVSITPHYGPQRPVLASVSPRHFFCTECHVLQNVATPPVTNDFLDVDILLMFRCAMSPVKTVEKQGSRFQKGGWAVRTAARKVRAIGLPSLVVPAVIDRLICNDRIGRLGDMPGTEAAIRVFILGESAPHPKLTLIQREDEQ